MAEWKGLLLEGRLKQAWCGRAGRRFSVIHSPQPARLPPAGCWLSGLLTHRLFFHLSSKKGQCRPAVRSSSSR
jgi:hypothetical protein